MIDMKGLIAAQIIYDNHMITNITLFFKNNVMKYINSSDLNDLSHNDIEYISSGTRYINIFKSEWVFIFEENVGDILTIYYKGDDMYVDGIYLGIYDNDIYFFQKSTHNLIRNLNYERTKDIIKFNYTTSNFKILDEL